MLREPHNLLIHAKDLSWWYPNVARTVFTKLNFALYQNDFCILTGVSGSGKTTLTKLILRQYKTQPKMLFHRHDDMSLMLDQEVQLFRRKVWVVFQDYKLLEWKTVIENIVYPLSIAGHPPLRKTKQLKEVLEAVGMEKQQDTIVRYLSGGEKQKVAIARALVHTPEFIIADEPTWNLDPRSSEQIADVLIKLHQMGHTILLITHDISLRDYIARDTQIVESHI